MKKADLIFPAIFLAATLLLVMPGPHEQLRRLAAESRYWTGFLAFGVLGTLQEALRSRLAGRAYPRPASLAASALMWGGQGLVLALAFWVVNGGVALTQAAGILPGGGFGDFSSPLKGFFSGFFFTGPFFTSIFVSLGVMHPLLAAQRLGVAAVDFYLANGRRPSLEEASAVADWTGFIKDEALRIILFRIPILTFVFMLPSDLWLIGAAWAGVLLGALFGLFSRR